MGIFARVLFDVLVAHSETDYSYLGGQEPRNDPIWYPLRRLAIAPEVISRLKAASVSNDKRATLNPDDFAYVCDRLGFTTEERSKLRAALLAQGVEIFLRDRMSPEEAGAATEITNLVYGQLAERFAEAFHQVRGSDNTFLRGDELEALLALVDRANDFRQAARIALASSVEQEASFWNAVSATAYNYIAAKLESIQPELAAEIRHYATL